MNVIDHYSRRYYALEFIPLYILPFLFSYFRYWPEQKCPHARRAKAYAENSYISKQNQARER